MKILDILLSLLIGAAFILELSAVFALAEDPRNQEPRYQLSRTQIVTNPLGGYVVSQRLPTYAGLLTEQTALLKRCPDGPSARFGIPPTGFPPEQSDLDSFKEFTAPYVVPQLPGQVCDGESSFYFHLWRPRNDKIDRDEECLEVQEERLSVQGETCLGERRVTRLCCVY